jgi:hypothetical protein
MPLNTDKIDDAALALLYLTLHDGSRLEESGLGRARPSACQGHDR